MNLIVRRIDALSPGSQEIEVVERKGLGHPDTVCDAVAEHISVCLCRYYLEHFGAILHHNVDKVLLCGGSARAVFGGGEVLRPIEIYIAGRAAEEYGGKRIPVHDIATQACREWIRNNLPRVDADRGLTIVSRIRPGSTDLTRLFAKNHSGPALANDTSCGAGFAPFTDLERVVLEAERRLNSRSTKESHPFIGEDIKIMGVRQGERIDLTIGCAFVSSFVRDMEDYRRQKQVVGKIAVDVAREITELRTKVSVNAADDLNHGDVFLTVTGTSAEAGDDGQVGRGNRTCGLITPYRPMSLEAAAGKNPVSHVGKLYHLVASAIAQGILVEIRGATDAECVLVSQIGRPVTDPQAIDVRVALSRRIDGGSLRKRIREIVVHEFERLDELRASLLSETVSLY